MSNLVYDIIVVGAGPAGLSVAIEAGKNNLSCLVIDKGSLVNTIRRYPTYAVFFSTSDLLELGGIPFPSVNKQPNRQEALRYYTRLVQYFKVQHALYQTVERIEKSLDLFAITTNKAVFKAKNAVIAIGYYEKYNKLNVPDEELEHVSHFYSEPYSYVGRKVTIVGGSNSAGEAALDLYRNGAEVNLVHRGAELYYKMKYWVKPDLENRIKEGAITAHFNATVVEIKPNEVVIETSKGVENIKTDHVLALTGYHPDVDFLAKVGILYNPETYIPEYNEKTLESNIQNLFLAGTVLTGKNTSKIFIENSRDHGKIIVNAIIAKGAQGFLL